MLAAVYVPGNQRLVLKKNYPIRELADNEVLLKVAATGVCHTDVAYLTGVALDTRSFVMGHEISGVPVKLGSKVDEHVAQKGKLYSILAADGCTHGTSGFPAILNTIGLGKDGGFAEYFIATPDMLVPVPSGVPPEVAAFASDAGVTAYHAIQSTAKVKPGDKVLIFGIGGLGHLSVQYAKYFGATVYVCDFKPAARKLALELGATEAFDLIELTNKTAAGFTVTTTVDFIASNQTFSLAMAALKGNDVNFPSSPSLELPRTMCGVLLTLNARADDIHTVKREILSVDADLEPADQLSALVQALKLFAEGTVKPHVHAEPLENVNKVIDELRAFEITGRKVVIPHHGAH
ncbi:chaperonin 10-like protein [Mycena filopes]|nr:chaperonin 10-like protein [Mycena filopes]